MQHRMNGGTNIGLAIQRAGQLMKPLAPETHRAVVLLTDGRIDSYQARVGWAGVVLSFGGEGGIGGCP
jgi:hypothetical protein